MVGRKATTTNYDKALVRFFEQAGGCGRQLLLHSLVVSHER